ncbi:MAG: hypothetical protein NC212_08940 [Staphylococcus sp.]|nr:hypothetical protein [Staphylococcus sp.]
MKKYLVIILLSALSISAQAQHVPSDSINVAVTDSITEREVYCMILGQATNLLGMGSKCTVQVDFGEGQGTWTGGLDNTLVDENGKAIKFKSMIDAMNFMTKFGWRFLDAYAITVAPNNHVYHWIMSKTVYGEESGREGIIQHRDKKKKKEKKNNNTKDKFADPIY